MESTALIDDEAFNIVQDHFREEQQSRREEFIVLSKNSERVHASYLFYFGNVQTDPIILPLCSEMYDTLVRRIGGTTQTGRAAGWMDLGTGLGIGMEYLKYIDNNHNIICQTDMVLKMFANEDDATFGKIINVLFDIERLDVIEGIYEPLNKLLEELSHKNKSEQDLGYHSITSKEGNLDIFRPKKEILMIEVPRVLQRNKGIISTISNDPPGDNNPPESKTGEFLESEEISGPSVMLTYSEDAIASAQNILNKIMNFDNGMSKINVISLDRLVSKVIASPENCIRSNFEKVDYIIPILTEKYLDAISSHSTAFDCNSHNLDCKYVTFIYNLMSTHYTNGMGCINTKVRPLLSQKADKSIYNRLSTYPLFCIWYRENDVEKLLTAIFPSN